MGPVPTNLALDRLVGGQLQQICIGAFDVQFRFMGENRIRGAGTVEVQIGAERITVFSSAGWNDSRPLCAIVGKNVVGWTIESSHVLAIHLEDSAVIRLLSEDSPYEDWLLDPELVVW